MERVLKLSCRQHLQPGLQRRRRGRCRGVLQEAWPCASQRVEHMPRPRLAFRLGSLPFFFSYFYFPALLAPFCAPLLRRLCRQTAVVCVWFIILNCQAGPSSAGFGFGWLVGWLDGWMVGTLPCTCSCVQCDRIFFFPRHLRFFFLFFFLCFFFAAG